jgi:hypothetical protein
MEVYITIIQQYLFKSIGCSLNDSVELSLSSKWTRASKTLINMQSLYVLRVQVLGKIISVHQIGSTCSMHGLNLSTY